ncbi:MAG TPA: peptidoglycan bridge formation protein FemAB, partial [Burkholderiales bacterium]|nr:peptidoglycan bridge formation protein FemAB [Burkholderiales bacterium]
MIHAQAEIELRPTAGPVVTELTASSRQKWDNFVRQCKQATFFHLSAWKNIMEDVFGHRTRFLMAQREGQVVGVLPLVEVKSSLFGHAVVSLPFCVYGGAATDDDDASAVLHENAVRFAKGIGAEYLEVRN